MGIRYAPVLAALCMVASGQVSSNQSLTGKYSFRQVLLITDGTANVTDTRTGNGTITFGGNGTFIVTGQQLAGTAAPAALTVSSGTYTVLPGGFVTLSNPLRAGVTLNARLGVGALVGSSTEAGPTIFDLFVAIPAPAQPTSAATLNGAYWVSSLEFPNGGIANIRDTGFRLTANGAGSFKETSVAGQAANLGNQLQTQTVAPMTYAVSPDGSGTLTFPTSAGLNTTTQLISGLKNVNVSGDGTYFIGGSTAAGGHGLVVGVKTSSASPTGFYYAAGMRYDTQPGRLAAVVGTADVNATALGGATWARRIRQSDGVFDAALLTPFTLNPDGTGVLATGGQAAFNGGTFTTSGVDIASSPSYEIYFGARMPPQSGTGVFLNPQGVLNSASFAPPGYPISPGGFVSLYGTGFGSTAATASNLPLQTTLAGVQVTINGTLAPVYSVVVSPVAQITAIVPFGVTGSTATIVVSVNSTKSNSVVVPLAATAPGIFSVQAIGIGDAAIRHLDGTVVSVSNPALRGEFVSVYLTGLGAVSPAVKDGFAAPGVEPLARITGPVAVYIEGQAANTTFAGLTPTLAGLYQLNIQIPVMVDSGVQDLAVQTIEGFTDMVNIAVD
jgi:uncharacterized protein (TIGR03437 family)